MTNTPDLTMRGFNEAFTEARRRNLDFFIWNGATFHTRRADGEPLPPADLCAPTSDERVKALVDAVARGPMANEDMHGWIKTQMKTAQDLRALE